MPPFEYWATPVLPGRTLVEASAGTGKTFAIAGLVLRLVLDGDHLATQPGGLPDLRRLLVVTFTVAATEELKTRIRGALRTALDVTRGVVEPDDLARPLTPLLARPEAEARLLAALDRVDEAGIFTIHGFCKRVLEAAAFESATPFVLDFTEDVAGLTTRAATDAWGTLVHTQPRLAALAVRLGWTPEALAAHHAERSRFPGTVILPSARPVADALAGLDDAARQLDAAWDPDAVLALLDGLVWTAKAHVEESEIPAAVRRVGQFTDDPDAVQAVRAFTPGALAEGLHGSRKVNKERRPEIEASPAFQACAAVAEAVDALHLGIVHAFSDDLATRVPALKERRGVLGFEDLLTRLHDALHAPGTADALASGIQRQFAVALVDEFQDTDPIQYEIFRRAFQRRPLYFVGDPKQAIYAFRGADIHAYLRAQREADRRFTLSTNWRSTSGLVAAVNAVFGRPAQPFVYADIGFSAVGSPDHKAQPGLSEGPSLVWWAVEPNADSGKPLPKGAARDACLLAVVAEARRLLDDGVTLGGKALEPGDLAVLVRSNTQAQEAQAALRAVGVPAVISRADDIRDAQETSDIEVVLRAIAHPEDARALRAALTTELWGWTALQISLLDEDDGRLADLQARLRDLQKTWRRQGVLRALRQFGEAVESADGAVRSATERLLAFPDGARRATNLRHVVEMLHEAEGAADRSPEDLLHWLRTRHDQTMASRDKSELRLESDDRAVQITTVHNAKGLEYEVVFLPYLWDVHSKDYDADFTGERAPLVHLPDGRVVYDLGSPDHDEHRAIREAERLAEFLRLAYVALTRARERAYVAWGAANEAELSSLGLLISAHNVTADTDAGLVAAVRQAARKADPLAALAALVGAHPDVMAVWPMPDRMPSRRAVTTEEKAPNLGARALGNEGRQRSGDSWSRASFSAWTSGRHAALSAADEPDDTTPREPDEPTGIHAFAAGKMPGTALHTILEKADWPAETDDATRQRRLESATRTLAGFGLDAARRHRAAIDPAAETVAMMGRLDHAGVLGGARLCDADVTADEWQFTFPLSRVAPWDLAHLFRQHGEAPFAADYADALSALSRDAADGFLTGSADLVACHDDRWWIVDWKSNRLGPDADAYTPATLADAMRERHYGLQLTLYTLGLHRYLRTRIDGYAYDTHIGGGTYVFLRGLSADDPAAGLFSHRPPPALIDALDALLTPHA